MLLLFLLVVHCSAYAPIPDCTYAAYDSVTCSESTCWNVRTCGIRAAVDTYTTQATIDNYGPIADWDTSLVTDMQNLFYKANFNEDLSKWDTSSVINMAWMFEGAAFNQDLSRWKTSQVTDMRGMFYEASAFNQDLSLWDTSSVYNMAWMFRNSGFDRTLCGGAWESLTGIYSAFNLLGSSTARHGCCKAGRYILDPHKAASVDSEDNCGMCEFKSVKNADPQCCRDEDCQRSNGACLNTACTSVVCDPGYGNTDNNTTNGCESCPSGKFQYRGDTCESCPAGRVSQDSQSECKSCPAGKFSQVDECKSCPVGWYQNQLNQGKCNSCDNDSFSKPGATENADCFHTSSIPKSMLKAAYSVGC